MFIFFNKFIFFIILLFLIGLWGLVVLRTNLLIVLMSFEIILYSLNLFLIYMSSYFDILFGQVYILFILALIAIESALGLAILIIYYRLRGIIDLNSINNLKG